jgi:hypothetical protein
MARPIIGAPATRVDPIGVRDARSRVTPSLDRAQLARRLRERRSQRYIDAVKRLDAGTYTANSAALQDLLHAISDEFPELGVEQHPLGFVSRCYLGAPFVVHICNIAGNIVEHFENWKTMPTPFERARTLALHDAYQFIEVYRDMLRTVDGNGNVAVIEE